MSDSTHFCDVGNQVSDSGLAMLDGALSLASRGFRVLPLFEPLCSPAGVVCSCPDGATCNKKGKHPRILDPLNQATVDPTRIRTWWSRWPTANIGIATAGPERLVVLDIDGEEGRASLAKVEVEHGPLGATLTARSGRDGGGTHFYFRCPDDLDLDAIRSQNNHVAPKIDQKANGGYVVAPASLHVTGRRYAFEDATVPVRELPRWLFDLMTHKPARKKRANRMVNSGNTPSTGRPEHFARAVEWLARCDPSIQGENGSARLAHAACGVVRGFDLDDESAYRALIDAFNGRCVPPWSAEELRHVIENMRENGREYEFGELLGESFHFERGDHVELAEYLLQRLSPDSEMLVFDEGAMHRYRTDSGLWQRVDEAEMSRVVQSAAGQPAGKKKVPLKLRHSDVVGAIQCAREQRSRTGFFAEASPGLAFENGFVEIRGEGITLRPHDSHWRARAGYPFVYDPRAPTSKWYRFLFDIFRDDADAAEKVAFLLMFAGAALVGIATRYQRCAVLLGDGNNGKSTLIEILRAAMPPGTCCAIPPQDWKKDYRLAELAGQRFNAVSELPEADILESETVKAVITGDATTARRIYEKPFELRSIAGHLFAANALPGIADMTTGFWRRFVVLRFSRTFSHSETRPNIAQEIIATELPGIVASLLEAARFVLGSGGYVIPSSAGNEIAEWRVSADTVAIFVREETREAKDEKKWSRAKSLYLSYRMWCEENGFRAVSSKKFAARMTLLGKGSKHDEKGSTYPVIHISELNYGLDG